MEPTVKTDEYELYLGDCLEVMQQMEDDSVDAVITDPPYGTTAIKWDKPIGFDKLWPLLKHVSKPKTPTVLFGTEPFSTMMRASNLEQYRYDWYWIKNQPTGFAFAKFQPMRNVEILSVFYEASGQYYPQQQRSVIKGRKFGGPNGTHGGSSEHVYVEKSPNIMREFVHPTSAIRNIKVIPHAAGTVHPTQKPVSLMRYLIKTYTLTGDKILDFAMGSGTTGVACRQLERKFIGIEINEEYFDIACKRLEQPVQRELL